MELRILGPLDVSAHGVNGTPSAPKLRKILALLLVHANEVVPVSSLITELWDDNPPRSGLTTLQTYILHLRKLLATLTHTSPEDITHHVLLTTTGGYTFHVTPTQLDLHQFHHHRTTAHTTPPTGPDKHTAHHLRAALALWRGPALVDVPPGRLLESKIRELQEWHLATLEHLIETELRLGLHRDVIAKLASLTHDNPLHEGLHRQYMLALHLGGRRAQALEVFHRLRHTLITELGLEPAPHLQHLQQAILTGNTDLKEIPTCRHEAGG